MYKAGDRPNEAELVAQAIAEFPAEFGLRSEPGKVFSISSSASYVSDAGGERHVELYVYVKSDKLAPERTWSAWAKGTASELRRQIIPLEVSQ
jgi:hypothetical protein